MSGLDSLLGALVGVPALPGAKCRGRSHLFDPATKAEDAAVTEQRHGQALLLCAGCPSRQPCRDWVASLPPRRRPVGVVAGQVIAERKPRKAASA
jgi:WhiB family redox-sensing transcriptional regulator